MYDSLESYQLDQPATGRTCYRKGGGIEGIHNNDMEYTVNKGVSDFSKKGDPPKAISTPTAVRTADICPISEEADVVSIKIQQTFRQKYSRFDIAEAGVTLNPPRCDAHSRSLKYCKECSGYN